MTKNTQHRLTYSANAVDLLKSRLDTWAIQRGAEIDKELRIRIERFDPMVWNTALCAIFRHPQPDAERVRDRLKYYCEAIKQTIDACADGKDLPRTETLTLNRNQLESLGPCDCDAHGLAEWLSRSRKQQIAEPSPPCFVRFCYEIDQFLYQYYPRSSTINPIHKFPAGKTPPQKTKIIGAEFRYGMDRVELWAGAMNTSSDWLSETTFSGIQNSNDVEKILRNACLETEQSPDLQPKESGEPHEEFNEFRYDGKRWWIRYEGTNIGPLNDSKGMHDLCYLLKNPGKSFSAEYLFLRTAGDIVVVSPESQPVLDDKARANIKRQIENLEYLKEKAEESGDSETAQRHQQEIEAIQQQRDRDTNIHGNSQIFGDCHRTTVYKRITAAIDKIVHENEPLGTHLKKYVMTGKTFSYTPPSKTVWITS